MSIVISTLTGKIVNPQTTCAFSMNNGEYVPGAGTAHFFIGNAASNWGLTCERVGKDRMDYVVQSLKEGKMVVEICEAYTITEVVADILSCLPALRETGILPLQIVRAGREVQRHTALIR